MFENTEKQYICKFILWFKVYVLVRENQDMHMGETRLVHAFNIKDTSNMQCIRQDKNNWIQTIVGMQQKKDNQCRFRICVFNELFSKTICFRMFEDIYVHARGQYKAHIVSAGMKKNSLDARERERKGGFSCLSLPPSPLWTIARVQF